MLDSGNFFGTPDDAGRAKTTTLLDGMQRMGYLAVNVGEREVREGYATFLERVGDSGLPFVSANIVRQSDGRPVFEPHRIVEATSADGAQRTRIGVIGIARYNPLYLKDGPGGEPMVLAQPDDAVARSVAALQAQKVDLIVLLAAVHKEDAKKLVAAVPGIDYVLGSYGGAYTSRSELVGATRLLYCGNRGQRLSESRVFFGDDGGVQRESSRMHFLTAQYPVDPPTMAFVNQAVESIAAAAAAGGAGAGAADGR